MKKAHLVAAVATLSMSLSVASAAKIVVWSDFGGGELKWLSDAAAAFSKTAGAKGNTIEVVSVPNGQLRDKFIATAPKGEGPDLAATIPHDQLGGMAAAGVLEPMNQYLSVAQRADLQTVALQAFNYQGKLLGLPMFGEAVAIVYNKKLLPGGVPKTWDAFIKTAQSLTKPEQQQFGFLAPIGIQYHMNGIYQAMGAYVFGKNKDGSLNQNDIGLDNAGAAKAAQVINDLRFKYNLIPQGAEDGGLEKNLFTSGKLAMMLTGPWDLADIKKAGIDYGIDVMPRPTGAVKNWSPFVGIRGVVMNAYSKNKAAAAAFAKYLVTPESQISLNKAGGRVPVSRAALATLKSDPTVVGFGKAIGQGVPMPNIPAMGQVWEPWGNALALIIKAPNPDIAKLNTEAVAQIKAAIAKMGK